MIENFFGALSNLFLGPNTCAVLLPFQVISNLSRYMREPGANDELLSLIIVSAAGKGEYPLNLLIIG